jgi:hypothetical protein
MSSADGAVKVTADVGEERLYFGRGVPVEHGMRRVDTPFVAMGSWTESVPVWRGRD